MKKIVLLFCCLLSLISFASVEQNKYEPLSNKAEISILTVGTGQQLYALFGHTAVRIYDPILQIDRVYNYGLFNFATSNFYLKFIKGDLQYYVDYEDYKNFVLGYAYEDRSVYEQHLQLTNEQKQEFWQLLNASLEPEHRNYTYKFIDQNCTTKVVDLLNKVLDEPVISEFPENNRNYREILNSFLHYNYFEKLGINLIFGYKVDSKSEKIFLPDMFMMGLSLTKNMNSPLVDKTKTLYEKRGVNTISWWNNYIFFSVIIFILAIVIKRKSVRSVFFVIMGALGIFFISVGFYSLHKEVLLNNTVLLCNPLMLIFPFINPYKYRNIVKSILGVVLVSNVFFVMLNITSEKLIVAFPLVVLSFWSLFLYIKALNDRK